MAWELLRAFYFFIIRPRWRITILFIILLSSYTYGLNFINSSNVYVYSISYQAIGVFFVALFNVLGPIELRHRLAGKLSKYIEGSESILRDLFESIGSGLILSGLLIQISVTFGLIRYFVLIISSIFLIFAIKEVIKHKC